ncbi:hypothetical protein BLOT_002955 [Blomia tropicalis]|nr:hypothetical protein BLOT_002955 [Blomia tropicalis]
MSFYEKFKLSISQLIAVWFFDKFDFKDHFIMSGVICRTFIYLFFFHWDDMVNTVRDLYKMSSIFNIDHKD